MPSHCLPDPRGATGDFLLIKISKGLLSMHSLVSEVLSKAVHQEVSFVFLSFFPFFLGGEGGGRQGKTED